MNHTGLYPLLKTKEGTLNESVAIAKYLCSLADGKLLGKTAVEQSHVDQWISFANTTVMPCSYQVNMGIFGWGEITQTKWNEESKNLKAHIKVLNTALEGKKFLVGDSATLADLVLIDYLFYNFQTVLDGGFRKAMKNVDAWAQACLDLPEFVKVFGKVQMCAKPLKPTCVQEKKEPAKKAAAPPPKPKVEKAEKPKDNVESLPPTPFNLFDFKTLLINHPDIKGKGVDTFYEMLDWEGWSFWFLHYDKYGSEGTKLHVTNNLMTGFLSRAEHTTKYTFGRHCVLGEEPNLEIMGVWLMRGAKEPLMDSSRNTLNSST